MQIYKNPEVFSPFVHFLGPVTYYPSWERRFPSRGIFDDDYENPRDILSWRTTVFGEGYFFIGDVAIVLCSLA